MSSARRASDALERAIEAALAPGRFVSDRACFSFVDDLEEVQAQVAKIVQASPPRAIALYEAFLAGCYEKAQRGRGLERQSVVPAWRMARLWAAKPGRSSISRDPAPGHRASGRAPALPVRKARKLAARHRLDSRHRPHHDRRSPPSRRDQRPGGVAEARADQEQHGAGTDRARIRGPGRAGSVRALTNQTYMAA